MKNLAPTKIYSLHFFVVFIPLLFLTRPQPMEFETHGSLLSLVLFISYPALPTRFPPPPSFRRIRVRLTSFAAISSSQQQANRELVRSSVHKMEQ